MRKPAFAKSFALTETQRAESGAWIYIGNWVPVCNLNNGGSRRVLCVPPSDDPLTMDWSVLHGLCATVWLYIDVDLFTLAACLRAFAVRDIAFIDRITGRITTANTPETDSMIELLSEVA